MEGQKSHQDWVLGGQTKKQRTCDWEKKQVKGPGGVRGSYSHSGRLDRPSLPWEALPGSLALYRDHIYLLVFVSYLPLKE